jgi:hypothetical protein
MTVRIERVLIECTLHRDDDGKLLSTSELHEIRDIPPAHLSVDDEIDLERLEQLWARSRTAREIAEEHYRAGYHDGRTGRRSQVPTASDLMRGAQADGRRPDTKRTSFTLRELLEGHDHG